MGVLIVALSGWWWLAALLAAWGVAQYRAVGLLVVTVLIDAYYGMLGVTPLLTVLGLLGYVLDDWIRPRLYTVTTV
jgi:hypothetical protein